MKICSKHFKKDDFYLPDFPTKSPTLLKTAVPSVNLPGTDEIIIKKNEIRLERRLNRSKKLGQTKMDCSEKDDMNVQAQEASPVNEIVDEGNNDLTEEVISDGKKDHELPAIDIGDLHSDEEVLDKSEKMDHSYSTQPPTPHDEELHPNLPANPDDRMETQEIHNVTDVSLSAGMQILTPDDPEQAGVDLQTHQTVSPDASVQNNRTSRVLDDIKSDKQLSTVRGIESSEIFNSIVECVKFATKSKWERDGLMLNTVERVLLVFVKLKQNSSFNFLAFTLRPLSETHCSRIFFETLKVLSKCLKSAVSWPSKESISSNLPQCFEKFENTRIIADCSEIFIQCPRKTCCQIHLYSYYKGSYTVKVMIGICPAGNITFVSKPYGGRWSDSAILEQSKLLDLLEPGDAIMVDQGFLVDELCHRKKIHLIRPPFKKGKQLSEIDALWNVEIAKARVHVERVNQRLKVFEILGETFPISLMRHFEDILTVICGTVNLSSPIISDDKFMK